MNSERLFQRARQEHPKSERIEVKFLITGSDCPVDDGYHDWEAVTGTYADDIGNHVRVIEVAICHYVNGVSFVFGDDVTEAAEAEIDSAPITRDQFECNKADDRWHSGEAA